jgi:hypothetical protein
VTCPLAELASTWNRVPSTRWMLTLPFWLTAFTSVALSSVMSILPLLVDAMIVCVVELGFDDVSF